LDDIGYLILHARLSDLYIYSSVV